MKILPVYSLTPCTILNFKQFYVCEGSAVIPFNRGLATDQLIYRTWIPWISLCLDRPCPARTGPAGQIHCGPSERPHGPVRPELSLPHRMQSPNSLSHSQALDGSTPLELGTLFRGLRVYPPPSHTHPFEGLCNDALFKNRSRF